MIPLRIPLAPLTPRRYGPQGFLWFSLVFLMPLPIVSYGPVAFCSFVWFSWFSPASFPPARYGLRFHMVSYRCTHVVRWFDYDLLRFSQFPSTTGQ